MLRHPLNNRKYRQENNQRMKRKEEEKKAHTVWREKKHEHTHTHRQHQHQNNNRTKSILQTPESMNHFYNETQNEKNHQQEKH